MRAVINKLFLCTLSLIVAGCAGVGVIARSDPATKLRDAGDLFERQDQPLMAEKLIREAIESYQNRNDQQGLADAYRTYGFFFRSPAIEGKWSRYYREKGFLDESASFDARYGRSVQYLEQARAIYEEYRRFDALTNVNLNIGFTYEVMGYGAAACEAFDRSLENNRDNLRQSPKARLTLPQGYATYEEFLAPHQERVGCRASHNHRHRKYVAQAA